MKHIRQFHFWLRATDYEFLCDIARTEDRTVGAVLRELIRDRRERTHRNGLVRGGPVTADEHGRS